jgi:hypothetical protein
LRLTVCSLQKLLARLLKSQAGHHIGAFREERQCE